MARKIVVTAAAEGALYSPDANPLAPIRIYSDGTVEDDICVAFGRPLIREKLDAEDLQRAIEGARSSRARGLV